LLLEKNMIISIQPALEAKLRDKAKAEGITVEAYVERLLLLEELADSELESLALEGLESGDPIVTSADYWEQKHRHLDERLKKTGTR
jgi:hypothetical protein